MSRVLITGTTGMVGSHLIDFLLEETNWEIYGLLRWNDDLSNINHLIPLINKKSRDHLVYGYINYLFSMNNYV
jgi:GDPmannose 4,6-dehydratase